MAYQTPMLQQYQAIKEQYPDCLLFFRLGDFYELFGDDAKIGSEVLHITLTARAKGSDGKIPMCGVPFHASENYVARLVNAGYKVAICEQVSDPPAPTDSRSPGRSIGAGGGKGLVKREVVRVVTAGTLLRDESLTDASSQFIMSLVIEPKLVAGAAADLSTGQFFAFSLPGSSEQSIPLLMSHFSPRECVVPRATYDNSHFMSLIRQEKNSNITCAHDWLIYSKDAEKMLKSHFQVNSLDTFGLTNKPEAIKGAAALLGYLRYTQKGNVEHITSIREFHFTGHLVLDQTTLKHLEVIRTAEGDVSGSLFGTLNYVATAAGQRLLQDWLLHPLTDRLELLKRHEAITECLSRPSLLKEIRAALLPLSDSERLVGKLSVGLGSPRDLRRLADTLWHVESQVLALLKGTKAKLLSHIARDLPADLLAWVKAARNALIEEAKPTLDEGFIFHEGYNPELDTLRHMTSGNKAWLQQFEETERQRTGIAKLKVVYSRAFGYAIEISKLHKDKVPVDYVPRQTLVNADRYTCQALAEYEQKALTAFDQMVQLEKQLFYDQVKQVVALAQAFSEVAYRMALLDVVANFAYVAQTYHYVCPTLSEKVGIAITAGRHPVIEQPRRFDRGSDMQSSELTQNTFIPNDTTLTPEKSLQLITGPNMAGKSTYIRQIALIVLLAHTGCFVPAEAATIGMVDRIFTRIGAHDNLRAGQSTFMVEMLETAHILHNATKRSLVILDEVGRGTSPEDGFALSWAIAESLAQENKGLVLFATHFHALKELAQKHERVFNSHLAVVVDNEDLIFLRKVTSGPTDESFGIVVAEKAGVPQPIIARAIQMARDEEESLRSASWRRSNLSGFEEDRRGLRPRDDKKQLPLLSVPQTSEVEGSLKEVNIDDLTPLQALNLLHELQKKIK